MGIMQLLWKKWLVKYMYKEPIVLRVGTILYFIKCNIIIIQICGTYPPCWVLKVRKTEKTWIQTISDSKNKIMYRDAYVQCNYKIYMYIIFEKLWHKMSFEQRLKSSYMYTMTRFEFSWKLSSHNCHIFKETKFIIFQSKFYIFFCCSN